MSKDLNSKWKWDKEKWIDEAMSMVINRKEIEENVPKNYFTTDDIVFVEREYKEILFKVFDTFNFENSYKQEFYTKNITAKLIFYIQYFAGAPSLDVARMISYANLYTFFAATLSKQICGHKKGYSLLERLQFLFRFYIYEKDVYLNCVAKVCLASLRDHHGDQKEDLEKGNTQNNPFLTGEINEDMFIEYEKGLVDITKLNS